MEHIWIQDKLNLKDVYEHYNSNFNEMTIKWRDGKAYEMRGKYYAIPVTVRFYTSEEANKHIQKHLFCAREYQQVIFMDPVTQQTALYLLSRMRTDVAPTCPCIPLDMTLLLYQVVNRRGMSDTVLIDYPNGRDWTWNRYSVKRDDFVDEGEVQTIIEDALW